MKNAEELYKKGLDLSDFQHYPDGLLDFDEFKAVLELHDAEIKALIDEIDHTVDCATNASEVADEFRAMGCTCGRDKFVKQFKGKL